MERQRTELVAAVKSDSALCNLNEIESENICLDNISGCSAKVKFDRCWDSTLINDSPPYLPEFGAHVHVNNKDLSYPLPGTISDQITLVKTLKRRHAKIEKEIGCMPQFNVTFQPFTEDFNLTLECALVDSKIPPLLLIVPVGYPTVPVEYVFTKEYDSVPHLQNVRNKFEYVVLHSDRPASIHGFLAMFSSAIKSCLL